MNFYLAEILKKNSFNHFSISQLNSAYIDISGRKCPLESRRFVYKQVLRLLKFKVLYKNGEKNSRHATYEKTDLFNKATFINKNLKNTISRPLTISGLNKGIKLTNHSDLEDRLQQYKVDMMAAIGESEEYKRLLNSFPEMKNILNKNYYNSRDKSSKLLGKINAINTVLSMTE
jgi:hypothetical protein